MSHNSISRTPIAYYGGKISLLSHILPMIPAHEVYTETFFGGGAVFFAKEPAKNETINDLLDICVTFYKTVKTDFKNLKALIDSTLVSRTQHLRALEIWNNPAEHSELDQAWAFWVTCNFSFSNKPGGGIKYSNHQTSPVPTQMVNKKKRFTDWLVARLESVTIENNDALVILKSRNVPKAFHYLDPPYFNADMGHYDGYTESQLIDLLEVCQTLTGHFLLSNYQSEVLDHYVEKNVWFKKEIHQRLKAPKIKNRARLEILVSNYSPTCLIENSLFKS
jgi:DNA adenine methylase